MLSLTSQLSQEDRQRLLKSLHTLRIQHPNEVANLNEWLEGLLAHYDKKNRSSEGAVMHRGQGKAILLAEILETCANATELLKKTVSG